MAVVTASTASASVSAAGRVCHARRPPAPRIALVTAYVYRRRATWACRGRAARWGYANARPDGAASHAMCGGRIARMTAPDAASASTDAAYARRDSSETAAASGKARRRRRASRPRLARSRAVHGSAVVMANVYGAPGRPGRSCAHALMGLAARGARGEERRVVCSV